MNASIDTVGPMQGGALVADNLTLARGGMPLFAGLSFRVAPGEALLITGRNGAGKSSLLRAIAGLLPIGSGILRNPYRAAWAAGEPALKPDRSVEDELAFWAKLDGATNISVAIQAMGLDGLLDLPCGMLSSGQRQRVNLARAIASGALLWLLDEPTNALDTESANRLIAAI
ncbi:MAG: heme ABC exporter ATP-binding protein CcmA, partial [Sphingomonadaceae bacterium]